MSDVPHNATPSSKQKTRNESIQQAFGAVAKNYTQSAVHAKGADLDHMVSLTQERHPSMALDLGCGAGHVALNIAPHCQHVIAYDLTLPMLAQVRANAEVRHLSNIHTQRGDVTRLPFGDAQFDVVLTRYSAHHWHDPQSALAEVKRVLKPDGLFILGDIVAPMSPAEDTFLQAIELLRDPSHVRDHSITQWEAMMRHVGLVPTLAMHFDLTLHFETWHKRIGTAHEAVVAIHELMRGAPHEIRERFKMPASDALLGDFPFVIQSAVLTATHGT
jgi:ubiquinone/menaquinone biosynthesis C-methylase UbiE